MVRMVALVCVLVISAGTARADDRSDGDHRSAWRGVFIGTIAAAVIGGGLWVYGTGRVDDAEQNLCSGRHATDCGHAPPQDPAVVAKYNDQGWNGSTLTTIGGLVIGSAAMIGAVALYKGFIEKDPPGGAVAIAPLVSPTSAGATLRFQW